MTVERFSMDSFRFSACSGRSLSLALVLFSLDATHAAAWNWEQGNRYRSAPVVLPDRGKSGFTLLPPETTGIHFTNRLSDKAAGANRILENGSGVALGDVDGDGWCDIYFCAIEGP